MTAQKKYHELCRLPSEFSKANPNDPNSVEIAKISQAFEVDVLYAERHLAAKIVANAESLIPKQEQANLPPSAVAILDRFAVVDTLAIVFRSRSRISLIALLAIAFCALLILEFFAHILADFTKIGDRARWLFLAYPILWLGAWRLWHTVHSQGIQRKHHDYRALAEGLRVQLFWKLLGLADKVEEFYLYKQQGELEWICRSISWWREQDLKAITDDEATVEQMKAWKDLVCRCWIKGQVNYFKKSGISEKATGDGRKRVGAILFWSSMFLSVVLGGCEIWYSMQKPDEAEKGLTHLEAILIFAISMLLTGSAVAVAYAEKMAFSEHSRQYNIMHNLFHNYDVQLANGSLNPNESEPFRLLGKIALRENGDWLLLHRDRPLEIIVP